LTARGWDKHRSKTTSLGLFLSAISLLPLIFLLDLENKSKEKENNSTTSMSASVLLIIGSFASRLTIGAVNRMKCFKFPIIFFIFMKLQISRAAHCLACQHLDIFSK